MQSRARGPERVPPDCPDTGPRTLDGAAARLANLGHGLKKPSAAGRTGPEWLTTIQEQWRAKRQQP